MSSSTLNAMMSSGSFSLFGFRSWRLVKEAPHSPRGPLTAAEAFTQPQTPSHWLCYCGCPPRGLACINLSLTTGYTCSISAYSVHALHNITSCAITCLTIAWRNSTKKLWARYASNKKLKTLRGRNKCLTSGLQRGFILKPFNHGSRSSR